MVYVLCLNTTLTSGICTSGLDGRLGLEFDDAEALVEHLPEGPNLNFCLCSGGGEKWSRTDAPTIVLMLNSMYRVVKPPVLTTTVTNPQPETVFPVYLKLTTEMSLVESKLFSHWNSVLSIHKGTQWKPSNSHEAC